MKFLNEFIRIADVISQRTGRAVSWLTLLLVGVISYDVFARYFLHSGSAALQELEWHLFAMIFLIAAAFTLKMEEHVRVDVFYSRMSSNSKAWINIAGVFFFLIPFCVMVIVTSFNFVKISFVLNETSPDAGGLPARYLIKSIIPISFFLVIIQGLSLAFKSILHLKENK